jgi:hypothetical protein
MVPLKFVIRPCLDAKFRNSSSQPSGLSMLLSSRLYRLLYLNRELGSRGNYGYTCRNISEMDTNSISAMADHSKRHNGILIFFLYR